MPAQRGSHGWSYDCVWDQTEQGRRLEWLAILDEYTGECLCLVSGVLHSSPKEG